MLGEFRKPDGVQGCWGGGGGRDMILKKKKKKGSPSSKVRKFSRSVQTEPETTRREAPRILRNIGNDGDYSHSTGDGGSRQFYLNIKGWGFPVGQRALGTSKWLTLQSHVYCYHLV